jgi:hypothetical protein
MSRNLRAYSINNMYLSGIHAGIQTAHSHHELALKYLVTLNGNKKFQKQKELLIEYIRYHKTIVVLNGGMHTDLLSFLSLLHSYEIDMDYPFAEFYESQQALNGSLTNITIVLPEKIYAYSRILTRILNEQSFDTKKYSVSRGEFGVKLINLENKVEFTYSEAEIKIMSHLSTLNLMS